MKKKLILIVIAVLVLSLVQGDSCFAQYSKPRAPAGDESKVTVDETSYNPSGVVIGQALLTPGEKLPVLWGIMGPPDKVWAMRSKDDVNQDYVKLDYYSFGLSFDINSNSNRIQGILIEENSRLFTLKEVPFKIGVNHKVVLDTWGDPETAEPGIMAYWRRGVYIGVDDSGDISYIFLAPPGVFEDEKEKNKNLP